MTHLIIALHSAFQALQVHHSVNQAANTLAHGLWVQQERI
jgi:hypothetical protein